jgi:hypothetical protein
VAEIVSKPSPAVQVGAMMRILLKAAIKPLTLQIFRFRPISHWPQWVGDLLEIGVPKNLPHKLRASAAGGANINIILDLLNRTRDVTGDVAECGLFKASSLAAMALYLRENRLAKHVFGLDSFQGFDENVQKDIALGGAADAEKRVGGFQETSLARVKSKLALFRLKDAVILIPGYFAETLGTLPETRFSFVHLDCDIYDSYFLSDVGILLPADVTRWDHLV